MHKLVLEKEGERYEFRYDDASRAETLRVLGRFASNPELSFTWYDAALLSRQLKEEKDRSVLLNRFGINS